MISFVNGVESSSVSIDDRGLSYGHGLFETCLWKHNQIRFKALHLTRLQAGMDRLGIPQIDGLWEQIENLVIAIESQLENYFDEVEEQVIKASGLIIKLTVTAGSGPRGYAYRNPKPRWILNISPNVGADDHHEKNPGIKVKVCHQVVTENPTLAGIKHLNRLDSVLARMEWNDEFDEGLMLDSQQNVVEGTMSNVFLYRNGHWMTPAIINSGINGVARQAIIESGVLDNVVEGQYSLEEIRSSEAVFLCNSVKAVRLIDELYASDGNLLAKYPINSKLMETWKQLNEVFA